MSCDDAAPRRETSDDPDDQRPEPQTETDDLAPEEDGYGDAECDPPRPHEISTRVSHLVLSTPGRFGTISRSG